MTTIFWNTGNDGIWTTAANWNTGTTPGATDDAVPGITGAYAIQNYTVTLSTPVSVNSITISDYGADLAIVGPGAASVAADVNDSGQIILGNGGSLQVSGVVNVGYDAGSTGALSISNGGSFTSQAALTIGDQGGAQGTGDVSGAGSTLTVEGVLTMGEHGTGR
jgi:T5SS/PEP-CTERM-associated repeat protein